MTVEKGGKVKRRGVQLACMLNETIVQASEPELPSEKS